MNECVMYHLCCAIITVTGGSIEQQLKMKCLYVGLFNLQVITYLDAVGNVSVLEGILVWCFVMLTAQFYGRCCGSKGMVVLIITMETAACLTGVLLCYQPHQVYLHMTE